MKCSINFACIENENICLFTLDKKGRYTKFCSNNWTKLRNLCRVKLNKNDQDLSQFWTIIKISCLFFMVLIFCIPQLNFMLLCIKWPIEQNYIAQLEQGCFCYQFKKKIGLDSWPRAWTRRREEDCILLCGKKHKRNDPKMTIVHFKI